VDGFRIAALMMAAIVVLGCLPPNGQAPDRTVPAVVSVVPAHGAEAVGTDTLVEVTFSEAMERTATESAFSLVGAAPLAGSFAWTGGDTVLTFTPGGPLEAARSHAVTVAASATDVAGNALGTSFVATFVTSATPTPTSVTGSFVINADAASTSSLAVTLNVTSTGAEEMRFGNSLTEAAAAAWEPVAASRSWTLSGGAGEKTVYGELRAGDQVVTASDSIMYEPPLSFTGSLTVNGGMR